MNDTLTDIVLLRNNIDFACISQFFHTFQSAFRPWPVTTHDIIYARNVDTNDYVFETEDLERMILDPSERIRLEDLLVRMLRLATGKRFINTTTWQIHFAKEFTKKQYEEENPFYLNQTTEEDETATKEAVNYFDLDLNTRIHLLHLLCEWQLDEPEKFREHLDNEEEAVQWRVDPIGFDKKGNTFWLFDDNRLYKETPEPIVSRKKKPAKKKKAPPPPPSLSRRSSRRNQPVEEENVPEPEEESEEEGEWIPWKLLCCSKVDWEQFPAKYANSKHIDEQRFYKLLVNDLLPKIIPVMEEREKEIKKQEALVHRKRSSRIMIKELEALERGTSFEPEAEPLGRGRSSNRIEQRAAEREQHEAELAAKAREERVLERERRIAEREYRALIREKRQESEDPVAMVEKHQPPVPVAPVIQTIVHENQTEEKPKRKYVKKPKFDEFGNPIPRKVKLDKDGNPIPLKKRGRKPKNKSQDEEDWVFNCVCGVSGKNLDDGTPMIACEKCGVWQHIKCLQKSGQIEKLKNMDDVVFVCRPCEDQFVDIDIDEPEPVNKKIKIDRIEPTSHHFVSSQPTTFPPPQSFHTHHYAQQPLPPPPAAAHSMMGWQQASAVREPYYPQTSVLPPIRPPVSLSSIHNLINNIGSPLKAPSTPSSTVAEPPTPPSLPESSPLASPGVSQAKSTIIDSVQPSQKNETIAQQLNHVAPVISKPFVSPTTFIQSPSQAPVSTVRGPIHPVSTASLTDTVQVTTNSNTTPVATTQPNP